MVLYFKDERKFLNRSVSLEIQAAQTIETFTADNQAISNQYEVRLSSKDLFYEK